MNSSHSGCCTNQVIACLQDVQQGWASSESIVISTEICQAIIQATNLMTYKLLEFVDLKLHVAVVDVCLAQ